MGVIQGEDRRGENELEKGEIVGFWILGKAGVVMKNVGKWEREEKKWVGLRGLGATREFGILVGRV